MWKIWKWLTVLTFLIVILAMAQGPAPVISTGSGVPDPGTCDQPRVGNVYVRSNDTANAPIGVFRCTQTNPFAYSWQPVDHFVGGTLPSSCTVGDIAYKTGVTAGLNLYGCTSSGTWTVQSGTGPTGPSGPSGPTGPGAFSATSGSIGGASLAAGACTTGSTAVAGSTTGMAVSVSPTADPQVDGTHGVTWEGWVSTAGTVTIRVCAIVATTPSAATYNIRVIQ